MLQAISMLDLNPIQKLQNNSISKANVSSKPEGRKPYTGKIDIKEMANLINKAKGKEVLPTYQEIFKAFYKGELDPRKIGEFNTKVQGRDNSIRIYVCKNKKNEDCVRLEYRKKHEECNIYSTYSRTITFKEYDNIIKNYKD